MSHTQISFAAHAQHLVCPPPPASANGSVPSLAAPAEPGVGVDTPPVYDGVFTPLRAVPGRLLHGGWGGEWALDWQTDGCALDAPHWPPAGSHKAMVCGGCVSADGFSLSRECS